MDVLSLAEQDTVFSRKASTRREKKGPCPNTACRCQTDGFSVKWNGEKWVFQCRGCWDSQEILADKGRKRGWGDEIAYLRHYRGMSFQAAKAMVEGQEETTATSPGPMQIQDYQSDEWQQRTQKAIEDYVAQLWNPDDTTALSYVRGRGLHDPTIKQFQLGYSIRQGIPRLIIPSQNEHRYVAVYRRDLRPECDERWMDARGGTKNELYLADCLSLRKDYPLILCEDAFSAMSIWQECGAFVNVVATGSANCGQLVKWVARLARVSLVLVALDADEAGDTESRYWLERLKNARRMRPLLKDPNDMLQAGYDLREWVKACLDEAYASINPLPLYEDPLNFCLCGNVVENFSEQGVPYCLECWEQLHATAASGESTITLSDSTGDSTPDSDDRADRADRADSEYWTFLHNDLAKKGYYDMVARDEAEIAERVAAYNRLYHPHRSTPLAQHLEAN